MKIEHFAYQAPSPIEAAEWYCEHLGFSVARGSDDPVPVRFLKDQSGSVMIEIYNNPAAPVPDYHRMDPLLLHLAFVCPDVQSTAQRLVAAGATMASGPEVLSSGDTIAMLRDPWGGCIQLVNRAQPMI